MLIHVQGMRELRRSPLYNFNEIIHLGNDGPMWQSITLQVVNFQGKSGQMRREDMEASHQVKIASLRVWQAGICASWWDATGSNQ